MFPLFCRMKEKPGGSNAKPSGIFFENCCNCTNALLFHKTGRMSTAEIAVFIRKPERIQLA